MIEEILKTTVTHTIAFVVGMSLMALKIDWLKNKENMSFWEWLTTRT